MRRPQPLHPATFLIDQDGRVGAVHGDAQLRSQSSDLRRVLDVALEQDETPRLFRAQECALPIGQDGAGNAGDESSDGHQGRLARGRLKGQGNGR